MSEATVDAAGLRHHAGEPVTEDRAVLRRGSGTDDELTSRDSRLTVTGTTTALRTRG